MNILLTFIGSHDPKLGAIINDDDPGPILALVRERKSLFERIYLFSTPKMEEGGHTEGTRRALLGLPSPPEVEVLKCGIRDPIAYDEILKWIRHYWEKIRADHPGAKVSISVSSGTPQAHVCWFLLAASREIPAEILNIRPKKFAKELEKNVIAGTDPSASEFPIINRAVYRIHILEEEDAELPAEILKAAQSVGMIGEHPLFKAAIRQAAVFAPYDKSVLLLGETGCGKEMFANLIHHLSPRSKLHPNPLAVNCAGIPEGLAESLLFGHRRGAFNNAFENHKGYFEEADGNTLFLDELAEMAKPVQAKILRVMQDKKIRILGGEEKKVNVRLVAATNANLQNAVAQEKFRADLEHRFGVVIPIPSLRSRKSDIRLIAECFLKQANKEYTRERELSEEAIARLENYIWPGNIRELKSVIENAVIQAKGNKIRANDIRFYGTVEFQESVQSEKTLWPPELGNDFKLDPYIENLKDSLYQRALKLSAHNQTKAAKLLGVTSAAVSLRLQRAKQPPNKAKDRRLKRPSA